jgi:hypothetical protein
MIRSIRVIVLFMMLLGVTTAHQLSAKLPSYAQGKEKATFKSSNGDIIELDTKAGLLVTPRSRHTLLKECSGKSQVCLSDGHGFAFAYFRKCSDAGSGDYKNLRFRPRIVSALHDSDVWMVFDASPKYLFSLCLRQWHRRYLCGTDGFIRFP